MGCWLDIPRWKKDLHDTLLPSANDAAPAEVKEEVCAEAGPTQAIEEVAPGEAPTAAMEEAVHRPSPNVILEEVSFHKFHTATAAQAPEDWGICKQG